MPTPTPKTGSTEDRSTGSHDVAVAVAPGAGLAREAGDLGDPIRAERRRAVRLLLAQPLAADDGADPEGFALLRRHGRWLQGWFADQLGYRLVIEADFARLHKRPAPGARPRALRTRSGAPFDPRRYALSCLALAALERMEVQTTLSELAGAVQVLAASEDSVADFELDRYAERLAFVDAVRWLAELGVVNLTDGDEGAFVEGRGDALYDLHSRRMSQLLAAAVPPALAAGPEELTSEVYPDTAEGANRRIRHRLMRRLAEEPVLYLDELDEAEREYLASQRPHLVRQLAEATGLAVEVRREGLAAIDPDDRLSDLRLPSAGTVSHAALLVGEELAARGRRAGGAPEAVPWGELGQLAGGLLERYGRWWSKRYRDDPAGGRLLLADAAERLEQMGLALRRPEGVVPRPAIARLRPEEPAAGASGRPGRVGGEGGDGRADGGARTGEVPIGEVPIGEVPVGEVPIGEVPVGDVPIGEDPIGEDRSADG